ncbi:DUF998 domain-containing protein [Natrinema sp. 1APR25-10V2]|uniref:DUF998 domain-containing protein n=1 Tax=Natrinema sp. 1APR25-10V2 TaxID=2951081 RepID=UPI00287470BE|nr:DUF998 domain-containing protein [Natrinema sp. 1APR25-10V2]MDS0478478.1 DUF998 domain-containing protein [Natrinema sp. 1APR25-10V2]
MATAQSVTESETPTSDTQRFAGLALFVLSAQFMTVIMLGAAMAPGYDFGGGAISDLGVVAETAVLFNASLVAVGLLNGIGGYVFYRTHGSRWILSVYVLAGIGAIGAIGAGVFPLDTGGLHGLFALVAFLFFNVEAIASGTRLAGPMKAVSILAGVVGIAFVALMAIGDAGNAAAFGPIGHGGTERMIVYPPMLWLLTFGGYLMGAPIDDAAVPPEKTP